MLDSFGASKRPDLDAPKPPVPFFFALSNAPAFGILTVCLGRSRRGEAREREEGRPPPTNHTKRDWMRGYTQNEAAKLLFPQQRETVE